MNLLAERQLWMITLVSTLGLGGGVLTTQAHALYQDPPENEQDPDQTRQRGEQALADANEHKTAGRWNMAADKYKEALKFLPDNEEARLGLSEAMTMLNQGTLIDNQVETDSVQRERAIVEFNNAVQRAAIQACH